MSEFQRPNIAVYAWRPKGEPRVEPRHEGGNEEVRLYMRVLLDHFFKRADECRHYGSAGSGIFAERTAEAFSALLVAALKAETALSHSDGNSCNITEIRESLNDLRKAFRLFEPEAYRDARDAQHQKGKK